MPVYLFHFIAIRLDILFNICLFGRFQNNLKRILKYLIDTISLCMWYPKNRDTHLLGYCDSNFVGCIIDKKMGLFLFLNRCLLS